MWTGQGDSVRAQEKSPGGRAETAAGEDGGLGVSLESRWLLGEAGAKSSSNRFPSLAVSESSSSRSSSEIGGNSELKVENALPESLDWSCALKLANADSKSTLELPESFRPPKGSLSLFPANEVGFVSVDDSLGNASEVDAFVPDGFSSVSLEDLLASDADPTLWPVPVGSSGAGEACAVDVLSPARLTGGDTWREDDKDSDASPSGRKLELI